MDRGAWWTTYSPWGRKELDTTERLWASLLAQLVKNLPAMQEILVRFLGRKDFTGEGIGYPLQYSWVSLVTQLVKNLPAMQETWVPSLGLGRSPGEWKGYPLQYSGLENSVYCIAHGVPKSQQ